MQFRLTSLGLWLSLDLGLRLSWWLRLRLRLGLCQWLRLSLWLRLDLWLKLDLLLRLWLNLWLWLWLSLYRLLLLLGVETGLGGWGSTLTTKRQWLDLRQLGPRCLRASITRILLGLLVRQAVRIRPWRTTQWLWLSSVRQRRR